MTGAPRKSRAERRLNVAISVLLVRAYVVGERLDRTLSYLIEFGERIASKHRACYIATLWIGWLSGDVLRSKVRSLECQSRDRVGSAA